MTVNSNLQDTIREEIVKGIAGQITKKQKTPCKKSKTLSKKK